MRNVTSTPLRRFAAKIGLWRYRLQAVFQRLRRAWGYAYGHVSADDARRIMLDCHYPAGWHPLLVLTVEDTIEQARAIFADHPDLPRLIADGCARVGDKWEAYGDELYEARRWAIDVAEGYAADEGITLVRIDGEAVTQALEVAP